LWDEAERRRPPLAILTDFPGFHLRLARKLRPKGIRNVYYIARNSGVAAVARESSAAAVRAGAVYFPFRRKFLRRCRRPGEFIGHPLVGNVQPTMTREFFCKEYGLDERNKI